MEWYERVKLLKKEVHINSAELAERSGIASGTLNKLLCGQTKKPSFDALERLAAALGTSVSYLTDGDSGDDSSAFISKYRSLDEKGRKAVDNEIENQLKRMEDEKKREFVFDVGRTKRIRLFDVPVSAGLGSFLDSSASVEIPLAMNDVTDRADYAVRISGDSMEPRYYDGDVVIVESCGEIPEGKVGIFLYNGESYIKKYGGDRLRSVNPKYKDIVFKENDEVSCLGLVLGTISRST